VQAKSRARVDMPKAILHNPIGFCAIEWFSRG
jgi:hypothetical protein